MDINVIFSRTAPKKKVEIVENLTPTELLSITTETITRMVKEAGTRLYKSRDKELRFSYERRTGNNWDSTIEGVRNYKGKPVLNIYYQYENTDTNTSVSLDDFLKRGGLSRQRCKRRSIWQSQKLLLHIHAHRQGTFCETLASGIP